ncbi:glycosyltransferase [Zobellia nedashkovskayae]
MISLSVIIATFNSEKTLRRTLDSLLDQQISTFECVVVDGGSNDETIHIIKEYEPKFKTGKISFEWLSEPDGGIYDAWNKGLKLVTGDWISFLGSDDIYLPDALTQYQESIISLPKENAPHLLYSNVDYVKGKVKIMTIDGVWSWKKFQRYMCIAHVGSFITDCILLSMDILIPIIKFVAITNCCLGQKVN